MLLIRSSWFSVEELGTEARGRQESLLGWEDRQSRGGWDLWHSLTVSPVSREASLSLLVFFSHMYVHAVQPKHSLRLSSVFPVL